MSFSGAFFYFNLVTALLSLSQESSIFYSSKTLLGYDTVSCAVTLRRTGGSITLSIPKSIAHAMAVDAGSVVELVVQGHTLSVTAARRGLAERLGASPKSPNKWHRDEFLADDPVGREML